MDLNKFNDVNYKLLEELETDITENSINPPIKIDDSLYHSALETAEQSENINLNIRSKKGNLLNATLYNKPKKEDRSNKYVDGSTLNSYLSISDLQDDARENVHMLRSNISKIDNRQEKLRNMQEKSDYLMLGADKFNRKSHLLRNKMFWMSLINWLFIGFFIFIIVFLIIKLT